jgi:SOS regulatory protein LexA
MGLTKKQKDVYEYIKTYSGVQGIAPTQREIKEHFDLKSFGSVQRYLKYLQDAGMLDTDRNAHRGLKVQEVESDILELPMLGKIAAGAPILATENWAEAWENKITVPKHLVRGTGPFFALEINGESMIEEGILDGDVVIIKQQNFAQKGQIVAALIDDEATLKTYFPKNDKIELHPANQSLKPMIYAANEVKVLGIIAGLFRIY